MKLQQYSNQITGHDCLLTTEDNSTIFKVRNKTELHFYLNRHAALKPFTPDYEGVVDITVNSNERGQFEFEVDFAGMGSETAKLINDFLKSKQRNSNKEFEKEILSSKINSSDYRILDPKNLHTDSGFQSNEFTVEYENGCEQLISDVGCNPWVRRVHKRGRHVEHNGNTISYIAMKNLCAHFKRPCVLDLKMGKEIYASSTDPQKFQKQIRKINVTTSAKLGFRVCGLQVYQNEAFVCRDKYYGRGLSEEGAEENIKLYFSGGNELRKKVIKVVIEKVSSLLSVVSELKGYKFHGSSLAIFYEGANSNGFNETESHSPIHVRLVDFAHCVVPSGEDSVKEMEPDNGLILGLTNFLRILEKLK